MENPPVLQGENCVKSKHTEEQIINVIHLLLNTEMSLVEISNETNVSYGTVSSVFNKTSWKHLTKDITFPDRSKYLNEQTIKDVIIPRILNGEPDNAIAKDLNIGERQVTGIRLHKYYKHLTNGIDFEKHTLSCEDANPAKLQNRDVLEIINLYNLGYSPTELMKKYNVGRHAILDILHKNTWSDLTKDLYIKPVESKVKLTEDDVKTIIHRLKHGESILTLADEYGVYHSTI